MEVRRRLLDATQRERLDRSLRCSVETVNGSRRVKALRVQIVHVVVGVIGRRVARGALGFAEEKLLTLHLGRIGFELLGIEFAVDTEARRRWEAEQILELGHE